MIYKLFIMLVVILAVLYYFSVVIQIFSNNHFKVTKKEITMKALIPFYYWFK